MLIRVNVVQVCDATTVDSSNAARQQKRRKKLENRRPEGRKIKNPRLKIGGPNQKPLTIKPYPMKIHC